MTTFFRALDKFNYFEAINVSQKIHIEIYYSEYWNIEYNDQYETAIVYIS